jgi:undecaprenyl-diphosphatase
VDILFILKYIILGVIEGLTEFLPVSSTGHLIIFNNLLSIEEDAFNRLFLVVCQLAAILAVLVLYWPRIWKIIVSFFKWEKKGRRFVLAWIMGCVPAVVFALLFEDAIDALFFNVPSVVLALAVGALLLIFGEKFVATRNIKNDASEMTVKDSLVVGVAQCASLWPGFSRSASTIMGGWAAGYTTSAAADFSFFLAIPIMFGASGYSLVKYFKGGAAEAAGASLHFTMDQKLAFGLGCVVSFVVSLIVVKTFLEFLKKRPLKYFSYYRLGLSLVLLILMLVGIV